ncbi:FAD binding domain-containing protein [Trametes meyenii]|nr:FAD binding domain-containing protein [Trametes meyenii]
MLLKETKVDVLVIGAGPAGLMCANALSRAGIPVKIVDKRLHSVLAGQADGIHARTLEILQSYGLAERVLRESAQMHRAAFYEPGEHGGIKRQRREGAFMSRSARYPFVCTRHQGAIEEIFLDAMKPNGLAVDRPVIPTSLEIFEDAALLEDPCAYPVKVVLKHLSSPENDTEVVHAKFVIGADGAHSWVRKTVGISMEGDHGSDHIWGVVDILPDTDYPDLRNFSMIQSNAGSALLVPRENDLFRLYIELSDADVIDPHTGRLDKDRASPQTIIEMAQKVLEPYHIEAIGEINWWTIYIVGQRVANKYSVHDRVFIAGDACHTHSPKAGQGMNASMSDTHNLAWKLAYVLRGWSKMSLLKTYESERRKFAVDLINFDREWAAMFTGSAREAVSDGKMQEMFKKNGEFMSGTELCYEPSAIVDTQYQAYASQLLVGARMPPHVFIGAADARPVNIQDMLPADTRFKVLAFVGDCTNATIAERVRDVAEGLEAPGSFLKRYSHDKGVFDVMCVSATKKDVVDHTDFPKIFRSHWSKVLLDDTDMPGRSGGGGFVRYGIDPGLGAIVIVRPDGHVGFISPFDRSALEAVGVYFGSFMRPAAV